MAIITIVSGSPSRSSRLHGLTGYAESKLLQAGNTVETIYAADLPAEDLIKANFASTAIRQALQTIEKSDGLIVASPVYKAAYTGVLKTFLDLLPQKGLQGKVALPLFIGGTIAHLLSIDYALKPVLSAMSCTNILTGVYATDQWVARSEDGSFVLTEELTARLDDSLTQLHDELRWKAQRQ
ncbi:NADPH-dependent FMN reductase [Paenibacillus hemerocallicola]|uniref:NADPH-dependent FMN reductase n=1 Tax=Paenibacillus hemerocallicola TaxID=1172614 RepID=A0A5C4SZ69_9BACL|nr:NADPH-dependent FMN reductase [Paenibacillus hemerocallicola]TNJ61973.1 NADPH-dependent FMN reductase [Paenibacillus hemerocallicola]